MRPFTRSLCEKIGAEAQSDRRGLLVDKCLRVKGTELGEVFAIGDCAVSGNAPTAQWLLSKASILVACSVRVRSIRSLKQLHQSSITAIRARWLTLVMARQ